MVDDLKLITEALTKLENGALWALFAYIFYQLSVYASLTVATVFLGKLTINSLREVLLKKKETTLLTEIKIDDYVISDADNYRTLTNALLSVRSRVSKKHTTSYLHEDDIKWIDAAIQEKHEKERKEQSAKAANTA